MGAELELRLGCDGRRDWQIGKFRKRGGGVELGSGYRLGKSKGGMEEILVGVGAGAGMWAS